MFRKRKFPLRMEKSQCGYCLQKKHNKQELKNYCTISLPTDSSKIFERLLYDSMLKFFTENSLLSQNQSGFKPGDSCAN